MRGAASKALRLDCTRQAEDILRVAMSICNNTIGHKQFLNRGHEAAESFNQVVDDD